MLCENLRVNVNRKRLKKVKRKKYDWTQMGKCLNWCRLCHYRKNRLKEIGLGGRHSEHNHSVKPALATMQRTAQQRLKARQYTVSKIVKSNNIMGSVTIWCCQKAQRCILADEVNWKRYYLQLKSISVIIIQTRILPQLFLLVYIRFPSF